MSKARSNRTSPAALALRKFFVSGFVVLSFVAYAVHERLVQPDPASSEISPATGGSEALASIPASPTVPISQQIVSAAQRATSTPQPILPSPTPIPPTATPVTQGQYKDGIYAGASEDAFYGNVEVQVTIQNGQLADVQFLDYPHDRRTSQRINEQAMPYLVQEAIQAQKAPTNVITGATLTSRAYEESLADALNQARNGV